MSIFKLLQDPSLTLSFLNSLHRGIRHHLCRSCRPAHPGQTHIPHSGQQHFSFLESKSELRRHGMPLCFLHDLSACVNYALAVLFSVRHASFSKKLPYQRRPIPSGCRLRYHRLLFGGCRRHSSSLAPHASLHTLTRRGLPALPR